MCIRDRQYIKLKYQTDAVDLFSDDDMDGDIPVSYTHLDVYKRQLSLSVGISTKPFSEMTEIVSSLLVI